METQFKIGQKVTLKSGLVESQNYGGITFCKEMERFIVENNTIERLKNGKVYLLKNKWIYSESMVEVLE